MRRILVDYLTNPLLAKNNCDAKKTHPQKYKRKIISAVIKSESLTQTDLHSKTFSYF
jgi:hypothetical protein